MSVFYILFVLIAVYNIILLYYMFIYLYLLQFTFTVMFMSIWMRFTFVFTFLHFFISICCIFVSFYTDVYTVRGFYVIYKLGHNFFSSLYNVLKLKNVVNHTYNIGTGLQLFLRLKYSVFKVLFFIWNCKWNVKIYNI